MKESAQILDACCGSKMFHFDKNNPDVIYLDMRRESWELCDGRPLNIDPDVLGYFTDLPFEDEQFSMVIFDPPHLVRAGPKSWMALKYGKLGEGWEKMIRDGFVECFRVLRPLGTLIFKWNETQIPVSRILALTPEKPVVGNRCGKTAKTHWIVFMKGGGS